MGGGGALPWLDIIIGKFPELVAHSRCLINVCPTIAKQSK